MEWLKRALGYNTSPHTNEGLSPIKKEVNLESLRAEDMVGIMKSSDQIRVRMHRNRRNRDRVPPPPTNPSARFPKYTQSMLNNMPTDQLYAVITDPNNKGDKTLANVRIEFISRVRRHIHKHVHVDKSIPLPKINIALAREYYEMCKEQGVHF